MKKIVYLALFFIGTVAISAFAADAPVISKELVPQETKKNLKEDVFSVSSEDLNSSDSLNRVAGNYDTGYSSPEQSFHSADHGPAGPFAREKAEMSDKKSY